MILSRVLARRRIAANSVTSFRAAWGPVLFDVAAMVVVLAALWQPMLAAIHRTEMSLVGTILVLMLTIYLPFQIVIIISTIWAVKSRWIEEDSK